jgi:hypothetical protein
MVISSVWSGHCFSRTVEDDVPAVKIELWKYTPRFHNHRIKTARWKISNAKRRVPTASYIARSKRASWSNFSDHDCDPCIMTCKPRNISDPASSCARISRPFVIAAVRQMTNTVPDTTAIRPSGWWLIQYQTPHLPARAFINCFIQTPRLSMARHPAGRWPRRGHTNGME